MPPSAWRQSDALLLTAALLLSAACGGDDGGADAPVDGGTGALPGTGGAGVGGSGNVGGAVGGDASVGGAAGVGGSPGSGGTASDGGADAAISKEPTAQCTKCLQDDSWCSTGLKECGQDPKCQALLDCFADCSVQCSNNVGDCAQACRAQYPDYSYQAGAYCWDGTCKAECLFGKCYPEAPACNEVKSPTCKPGACEGISGCSHYWQGVYTFCGCNNGSYDCTSTCGTTSCYHGAACTGQQVCGYTFHGAAVSCACVGGKYYCDKY